MTRASAVLGLLLAGCTFSPESARPPATGSGALVVDEGTQQIRLDPDRVPSVDTPCEPGQVVQRTGEGWVCAAALESLPDDVLRQEDLDLVPWAALDPQTLPEGLADGDQDTHLNAAAGGGLRVDGTEVSLDAEGCPEGGVWRRQEEAWACIPDATRSREDVRAFVTDAAIHLADGSTVAGDGISVEGHGHTWEDLISESLPDAVALMAGEECVVDEVPRLTEEGWDCTAALESLPADVLRQQDMDDHLHPDAGDHDEQYRRLNRPVPWADVDRTDEPDLATADALATLATELGDGDPASAGVTWGDLAPASLPEAVALVAGEGCGEGAVPRRTAEGWACTAALESLPEDVLRQQDLDDHLGVGDHDGEYRRTDESVPWAALDAQTLPEGLADGDQDTLGDLGCEQHQVARYDGRLLRWDCGGDALVALQCLDPGQVPKLGVEGWECGGDDVLGDNDVRRSVESEPIALADGSTVGGAGIATQDETYTRSAVVAAAAAAALRAVAGVAPVYNLGLVYFGDEHVLRLTQASGEPFGEDPLSQGRVTIRGDGGLPVAVPVSSNDHQLADGAADDGSDLSGELFGTTEGRAWPAERPFFVYAVLDPDEQGVEFAISLDPRAVVSPGAAHIGSPGVPAAVSDHRALFFMKRADVSETHGSRPCLPVGGFRMSSKSDQDDWTVAPLDAGDGVGRWNDGRIFTLPPGQMGAAEGRYFADHGAAIGPAFGNQTANYKLGRDGTVSYWLRLIGAVEPWSAGLGGNDDAWVALPYPISPVGAATSRCCAKAYITIDDTTRWWFAAWGMNPGSRTSVLTVDNEGNASRPIKSGHFSGNAQHRELVATVRYEAF